VFVKVEKVIIKIDQINKKLEIANKNEYLILRKRNLEVLSIFLRLVCF